MMNTTTALKNNKMFNPWHFVWMSVIISELFTTVLNTIQSHVWLGKLSRQLLMIGLIDGLFVPLIVAPIVLYFIKRSAQLEKNNAHLQREIEECKLAERALARSEARYHGMIDSVDGFVYICSPEHRIEFMNDRLKQRTGHDATGELCYKILHERGEVCSWCVNGRVFSGETVRREIQSPKDNRWYYVTNSPIYNENGTISKQAMIIDITERKALEDELLKARKLESVGILAGGIAHDFNNMLSGILSNIELAKTYSVLDNKLYELLEEAELATFRAKDLTGQLLTFSKGGVPLKRTVALREVVRASAHFALRGSDVLCEFSIPGDLWPVDADEGQMSQVINNLILNAKQAMPNGGTVKISCKNITPNASAFLPLKKGRYVAIDIQDQGIGIAKEHLPKIFDPYFTTKQRGSGLGLATAYSIIEKHGGQIVADSNLGAGSVFRIYLPASEDKIPEKGSDGESALKVSGRVLVMDDDDMIRKSLNSVLRETGFEVALAAEGDEAIRLYQKAKEEGNLFDLVILDLTVPGGMGGKETIKRLLEIDPDVRAIVSSGYFNDPVMAEYKAYGFKGVVVKPYRIKDLREEVFRVLKANP